jgi:hypothetical protein
MEANSRLWVCINPWSGEIRSVRFGSESEMRQLDSKYSYKYNPAYKTSYFQVRVYENYRRRVTTPQQKPQ